MGGIKFCTFDAFPKRIESLCIFVYVFYGEPKCAKYLCFQNTSVQENVAGITRVWPFKKGDIKVPNTIYFSPFTIRRFYVLSIDFNSQQISDLA